MTPLTRTVEPSWTFPAHLNPLEIRHFAREAEKTSPRCLPKPLPERRLISTVVARGVQPARKSKRRPSGSVRWVEPGEVWVRSCRHCGGDHVLGEYALLHQNGNARMTARRAVSDQDQTSTAPGDLVTGRGTYGVPFASTDRTHVGSTTTAMALAVRADADAVQIALPRRPFTGFAAVWLAATVGLPPYLQRTASDGRRFRGCAGPNFPNPARSRRAAGTGPSPEARVQGLRSRLLSFDGPRRRTARSPHPVHAATALSVRLGGPHCPLP